MNIKETLRAEIKRRLNEEPNPEDVDFRLKYTLNSIVSIIARRCVLEEVLRFIDPLPEQPAEWSEDWREEDIQTRFAFYTYKEDSSVLYLSNVFVDETSRNHGFGTRILKAAEKVAETIGATTIRLKVKQDSPANAWYRKNGYGYMAFEDGYDWFEKNLEYMKPNKQEWSEEEYGRLFDIEHYLYGTLQLSPDRKNACIDFLKSLRPQPHLVRALTDNELERQLCDLQDKYPDTSWEYGIIGEAIEYIRQPHWKPSEEQLEGLEEAADKYAHSLGYDEDKDKEEIAAAKEDFIAGAGWVRDNLK